MPATYASRLDGVTTSVAVKAPVRVATTANITLSGLQSIDGVTVVTGDRVLVKNQTDQTENGIYNADTSNWSRALDFDGAGDAVDGTRVWIVAGSTLAGEEWNLTTDNPVVIGTDNIVFAQSPLQDAVDAAEAAQAAAEAAAGSVNLPAIVGGDAGKGLKVNVGETAFELTASALGTAALLNAGTAANNVVQLDGSGNLPAVNGAALTGLNAAFPGGHLYGLGLSNDTDAEHDILVAAGECRDDTNAENLVLAVAVAKQIDAGWAVGDDAGGLDAGSVTTNETYFVHLIKRSDTGVVDALFSLSATAPTMPANYDFARRIGAVLTDGSANVLPFLQLGDEFMWVTPPLDVNVTNLGGTVTSYVISVPLGISVMARGNAVLAQAGTADTKLYIHHPDAADQAGSGTATPLATISNPVAANPAFSQVNVLTNVSAQIAARSTTASTTFRWATLGWADTRGKNG